MSELEHALRAALADPPAELTGGIRDPLWDIEERIRRRRHKRRRGALAAMACAAVAAVVVPLSVYGTPVRPQTASSNSGGGGSNGGAAADTATPAPPAAVRKAATNLAKARGSRADRTAEWVQTTVGRFEAMQGDTNNVPRGREIYVVQIRGTFVCYTCKYLGSKPPTGRAEQVTLAVSPHVSYSNFGLTQKPYDLSKLGAVHTFALR